MLLEKREIPQQTQTKTQQQIDLDHELDLDYSVIYHNHIPIDVKYIDHDKNVKQIHENQIMVVKICSYGNANNISKITVELENEYDPFFNLLFQCDMIKYRYIKQKQGINPDFQQFVTMLIKCFNQIEMKCCSKIKIIASLIIESSKNSKFSINQIIDCKNMEIIVLDFCQENQEKVRKNIGEKYASMSRKIKLTEQRLRKIQNIIKVKNPTLLAKITKTDNNLKSNKQHTI